MSGAIHICLDVSGPFRCAPKPPLRDRAGSSSLFFGIPATDFRYSVERVDYFSILRDFPILWDRPRFFRDFGGHDFGGLTPFPYASSLPACGVRTRVVLRCMLPSSLASPRSLAQ